MPTYQYACTECEHSFEQFQGFHEDTLSACPACEGRLRKVFNAVGVVFKGSGFYRTDSRTDSGANGDGTGKRSESGDAAAAATTEKSGPAEAKGDSGGPKVGSTGAGKPAASAAKDSTSAA